MAALLVGLSVMAVVMSVALPVWSTAAKRAREDELVFRGEQYARAIGLYQRKYVNALPPSIDVLVNEKFLRKKYLDPVTGGEFQPLTGATTGAALPGRAGVPPGGAAGTSSPGAAGRSGFAPPAATGVGAGGAGRTGTPGRAGVGGPGAGIAAGGPGAGTAGSAAGGISGVASRSKEKSLRLYNGRGVYNEWAFVPVQRTLDAGGGAGGQSPGETGRGGRGAQTPGAGAGIGRTGGARGVGSFRPPTGDGRGFRPAPGDDDNDDD